MSRRRFAEASADERLIVSRRLSERRLALRRPGTSAERTRYLAALDALHQAWRALDDTSDRLHVIAGYFLAERLPLADLLAQHLYALAEVLRAVAAGEDYRPPQFPDFPKPPETIPD